MKQIAIYAIYTIIMSVIVIITFSVPSMWIFTDIFSGFLMFISFLAILPGIYAGINTSYPKNTKNTWIYKLLKVIYVIIGFPIGSPFLVIYDYYSWKY